MAAFLAHQAVEKLLKAGLILERKEIPRTHYLDQLSRELGLPEGLHEQVLDLTPDYTLARYPEVTDRVPYEHYDEKTASEKVQIAKRVLEHFHEK